MSAPNFKKGQAVTFNCRGSQGTGTVEAVRPVTKGYFIDVKTGDRTISLRPAQVQPA